MIPDIGLMIAAYILFRALEAVLHLGAGGHHGKLPAAAQVVIALLAILLTLVVSILAVDLWQAGTEDVTVPMLL